MQLVAQCMSLYRFYVNYTDFPQFCMHTDVQENFRYFSERQDTGNHQKGLACMRKTFSYNCIHFSSITVKLIELFLCLLKVISYGHPHVILTVQKTFVIKNKIISTNSRQDWCGLSGYSYFDKFIWLNNLSFFLFSLSVKMYSLCKWSIW